MALWLLIFISYPMKLGHSSSNTGFIFQGFKGASRNITLDGSSIFTSNGAIQLTNISRNLIGHAFYPSPLHMFTDGNSLSSFSTTFVFVITPVDLQVGGGHGIAFVIAPTKVLRRVRFGNYLGVLNPDTNGNASNHIFFVAFDTFSGMNDTGANRVGININNLSSIVSEPAAYYVDKKHPNEEIKLQSGKAIQAWIEYDGKERTMNVSMTPLLMPKPEIPLLSKKLNLSDIFKETMYVGFSASTGKLVSWHHILGWSFQLNGVAKDLDPARLPFPRLENSQNNKIKSLGVASGSSVLTILLIAILAISYLYYRKRRKYSDHMEDWEKGYSHRFSYKDLYMATKGFKASELLGSGGFGCVYRGLLPSTKEEVAIKKIFHNSKHGVREFVAEIASLGRLRHRHLVHLHGWCKRKDDLLLVYEYMPNGSLDDFLYGCKLSQGQVLNWEQRFKILRGIASALLYLHEEWEKMVVHRDVKASNVLLDTNMNPKLGDFGLARLYEHGKHPNTTHVVGTLGYMAPEVSRTGKASSSCDVYSYGILLLEVACGRRPVDTRASSGQILLVDWVRKCWMEGCILETVDPKLGKKYVVEEMEMLLKLGIICSHKAPESRPTMRQVSRFLDGTDCFPSDLSLTLTAAQKDLLAESSSSSSFNFGPISSGSLQAGGD